MLIILWQSHRGSVITCVSSLRAIPPAAAFNMLLLLLQLMRLLLLELPLLLLRLLHLWLLLLLVLL